VIENSRSIVIAGAGAAGGAVAAELRGAGINDFVILERAVISSVFDDDTDTWRLAVHGGETCYGRVVIAIHDATYKPLHLPWVPKLPGCNDFRGTSFHGAAPDPDFDLAGKRIAVIGSDSAAGRLIGRLTGLATSVKVFPLPPRRVVPRARLLPGRVKRWPRHGLSVEPVISPIDTLTASGIRTCDGAHHETDAIVYGTGFEIRTELPHDTLVGAGGLTIQQAWRNGMEPYRGVALHGFPNYFMLGAPEFPAALRYVVECLRLMKGHTRIEVRHSTERLFNERVHLRAPSYRLLASAFDLVPDPSSPAGLRDDTYDGPATLTMAGTSQQVRVRLTGHIDPIDGQYHWQGTVFDFPPADLRARARSVSLTVGKRCASARITEETSQGTHSIAGVGAPPFALADVEITVPPL
jgi:cation diffusion facilitator CzcD-associated flavoprotein CzcO